MKRKEILKMVIEQANIIVEKYNLELFDVEISTKGGSTVLSVKITSDSSVGVEDCHRVHVELSNYLDELDPFEDTYYLEVASPGLDAQLKSDMALEKSIGKEVFVKTYVSVNNYPKKLTGVLKSFNEQFIEIEKESETYNIDRKMISTIRLHFHF